MIPHPTEEVGGTRPFEHSLLTEPQATPLSPLALQEAIAPCIAIALRSEAKERSREEKRNETKRNEALRCNLRYLRP